MKKLIIMDESLEQKIEERKKQAEQRKICEKGSEIAIYLGREMTERCNDPDIGTLTSSTYHFNKEALRIERGQMCIQIEYTPDEKTRKMVFKTTQLGIETYIPGPWEEILETLYKKVPEARKQQQKLHEEKRVAEKRQEETEERSKWGL